MMNRSAIWSWRIVFLLVFFGWICIWFLLPTKTYKNSWTLKLNEKLNSTYFREQGTNLLLFTFPIMLIAALGCVYLHYCSKSRVSCSEQQRFKNHCFSWKRPVLVMTPLGIVNTVELTFAAMFVALLIWSLANYLYVSFGHLHMDKPGVEVWQLKFRSVSLRLSYIGHLCWAFLFFPVTRVSSLLPLVGLSSESSIKYHIWLGHISMVLFAAHSIGFAIYWGMTHQMVQMVEWSSTYVSNVAGVIAFVVSLAMWGTSLYRVRRKMFELFFYSHHLYVIYAFFYILHVGVAYLCMILPGIFLFLIDRYLRFLQSRERTRLISARLLPCGTTELTFSKNPELKYSPASILFVNVPCISRLQWHPFTITSNSNTDPDKLSVAIKSQGSWSQKLYKQLSSSSAGAVVEKFEVSTEGPYGSTSFHLLRHEALVMIGGGSGISPFISIIREIIYRSTMDDVKVPKVLLIVAFKNAVDLAKLDLLLPVSSSGTSLEHSHISRIDLQIEAYITRQKQEHAVAGDGDGDGDASNKQLLLLQTTWFKARASDNPISAVLGHNSWLWLGAIISSSFLMFLLSLGIITRFWVYPIEKSGKIYHYSLKILWDMFLVCMCVFLATSFIFLLQKRKIEKEGKKILNVEELQIPSMMASPSSWLSDTDRERGVENAPCQYFLQSTKVHYGTRPDFKKILLNYERSSDVGVLVCGPRKMSHQVAKICSSTSATNLHFESLTFNW